LRRGLGPKRGRIRPPKERGEEEVESKEKKVTRRNRSVPSKKSYSGEYK